MRGSIWLGDAGLRSRGRVLAIAVPAVAVLAGALAGCGSGPAPDSGSTSMSAPATAGESGLVSNIVDGDTLDVEGVGRVRVVGIDTPERGACGYESATLALAAQVLGKTVSLVPGATSNADRYDRLLRYVDLDGVDVGLGLIQDGWAIARYDSRDGYGRHPREDLYIQADLEAPDLGCYPDDEP